MNLFNEFPYPQEQKMQKLEKELRETQKRLEKEKEEKMRYFSEKQELEKYKTAYELLTARMATAFADSLLKEGE